MGVMSSYYGVLSLALYASIGSCSHKHKALTIDRVDEHAILYLEVLLLLQRSRHDDVCAHWLLHGSWCLNSRADARKALDL